MNCRLLFILTLLYHIPLSTSQEHKASKEPTRISQFFQAIENDVGFHKRLFTYRLCRLPSESSSGDDKSNDTHTQCLLTQLWPTINDNNSNTSTTANSDDAILPPNWFTEPSATTATSHNNHQQRIPSPITTSTSSNASIHAHNTSQSSLTEHHSSHNNETLSMDPRIESKDNKNDNSSIFKISTSLQDLGFADGGDYNNS